MTNDEKMRLLAFVNTIEDYATSVMEYIEDKEFGDALDAAAELNMASDLLYVGLSEVVERG